MKLPLRDGIIAANGLTAEFRFIDPSPGGDARSYVETAAGPAWVHDSLLTYDPPRDLSPEAAAVVERVQDNDIDPKECNGD